MRFLAIGECMLELSPTGVADNWTSNFAGDTFNTAWYVRQLAQPDVTVGYFTAVGQDPISARMLAFIEGSGVETDGIVRHPSRTVGLYAISLSEGERTFTYWRNVSAARVLANDPAALTRAVMAADMVYFSGITVAIIEDAARAQFFDVIRAARAAGKTIAFDPNIRRQLWPSAEALREGIMTAASLADIALPGFDDEAAHFGDATPEDVASRYLAAGAREVVVKNGAGDVVLADGSPVITLATDPVGKPVDTTGAGDSFNGAYLAARLKGATLTDAAQAGQALARRVIMTRGALLKSDQPLA